LSVLEVRRERRRYGRIRLDEPLRARYGDRPAQVLELSVRGFLIAHEGRFAPGTAHHLTMEWDSSTIELECSTARSSLHRLAKNLGEQSVYRTGLRIVRFENDDFEFFYLKESPLEFPGIDQLVNLQKFFSITAKYPFLLPLVRQLIKVKPNRLYEFLGMVFYGYFGARFERLTIKEFIEFALASATFLTKKGTRAGMAPAAPISRTVGGEQQA
jgi:hypothetical protein